MNTYSVHVVYTYVRAEDYVVEADDADDAEDTARDRATYTPQEEITYLELLSVDASAQLKEEAD